MNSNGFGFGECFNFWFDGFMRLTNYASLTCGDPVSYILPHVWPIITVLDFSNSWALSRMIEHMVEIKNELAL